jgi:16S rRNA (uracil1498-N3)-methyltransferase
VNLFYQPGIPEGVFHLDPDESRHCIKVLRRKSGDVIRLTDGRGYYYDATITNTDDRQCHFEILSTEAAPVRPYRVHIAISPTKNTERIEWFVEKAVELGVDQITFMECEHTERTFLKPDRLQKVAISAMKQSLKASLPVLSGLVSFSNIIQNELEDARFIAFVDPDNQQHLQAVASSGKSSIILIGPEGDFSKAELDAAMDAGYLKVSLGKSRLRTETAGLAACHILNLINE